MAAAPPAAGSQLITPPEIPPDPIAFLGVKVVHIVAGLMGGMVRAITRPDISWGRRVGTGIVGALVAGYGTPIAAPMIWHWLPDHVTARLTYGEVEGLAGFVLGLTGLSLADGAVRMAREWRDNPTFPPRFPPPKG